jgi:predicted MPP superfamily phosphohydrolase
MVAALIALAAVGLACAYRGFLIEPWRIHHHVLELPLHGVPPALARARILFLTDLHTAGWGWREVFMSEVLRRNPPDMLILTGDLLSGPAGVEPSLELLSAVKPPLGTWYVRGNNEVEELADGPAWMARLRGLGWNVLQNDHRIVEHPEGGWAMAGVDDPNNELDRIDEALKGIPPGTFTILLSHTPETWPDARAAGVALTLSGHTHGGQVQFPIVGPLWGDTPRTGRKWVAGVFSEERSTLVVSRGIGWSIMPLRFLCTPEVIELKLVPRASA